MATLLARIRAAHADPSRAVENLLHAWREAPTAALAEAIARLAPEPAVSASTLAKEKIAGASKRLAAWKARDRDPRLVDAALAILAELPFTSNTSQSFYRELFAWLVEVGDPRLLDAAKALPEQWKVRSAMRAWLIEQLDQAVAALKARYPKGAPTLAKDEAEALAAIASLTPKPRAPSRREGSDEELLAAVWSAPHDDGPRQVYADFLQERGDPRGEFIALQLANANDKASAKRIKALLEAHGRAWLGRIEPAVLKDFDFARGFVVRAAIKLKHPGFVERYGALPEWSTVEELLYPQGILGGPEEVLRAQQTPLRAAISLKAMLGVNKFGVEQLVASKEPWPIQILGLGSHYEAGVDGRGFERCTSLPQLVEIRHDAWGRPEDERIEAMDWVWKAPFSSQIKRIDASTGLVTLADWIATMRARPTLDRVRIGRLALWSKEHLYGWIVTLTRDGDRIALSATNAKSDPGLRRPIDEVLARIPNAALSTITLVGNVGGADRAPFDTLAKRLKIELR